jgi:hypothetical protein
MSLEQFTDKHYHYVVKIGVSYTDALNFLKGFRGQFFIKLINSENKFIVVLTQPEDFLVYGYSHADMSHFCGFDISSYERMGINKTVSIINNCGTVQIYYLDIPKGRRLMNYSNYFEERVNSVMNWGLLCQHLSQRGLIQLRETDHEYRKNLYDIISINGEPINCSVESLNYEENGTEIRDKLIRCVNNI